MDVLGDPLGEAGPGDLIIKCIIEMIDDEVEHFGHAARVPPECMPGHLGKWHPLPYMKQKYDETRLPGEGACPGDGTAMADRAGREAVRNSPMRVDLPQLMWTQTKPGVGVAHIDIRESSVFFLLELLAPQTYEIGKILRRQHGYLTVTLNSADDHDNVSNSILNCFL